MLTDLTFLNIGQSWPPSSEKERLQKYSENKLLFKGKHNEVYKDWVRLLRDDKKATLELILNWHKRLSLLWADLLLSEPPKFAAGKESSKEQVEIDKILEENDLFNTAYELVIDISRFGTGIFNIYTNGSRGVISATPTDTWFPVVDNVNIKNIIYHILAQVYTIGAGEKQEKFLQVQIHERGRFTIRKYQIEGGIIKREVVVPQVVNTGLSDFAIIPVNNVVTSDEIIGSDDYTDLDSIIQEMEIRIAQISRILDKHSDPNMYGDENAMEEDPETGETTFRGGGKFFPVSQGGQIPGYIVWDAQLDANWKQLEFLLSQLYILSETSAACFGDLKQGLAESGSALRRLMMAALAKTQRIRLRLDPAIKKAVKLCSQINGGANLTDVPVNIFWKEGLPRDEKEDAEIMAIRTGSSGGDRTISRRSAIKRLDNLTDEELDQEMERITEDEMASNPMASPPFSGDNKI